MVKRQETEKLACNAECVELTLNDLPLACPPRDKRIWDAHPRIYLPIETLGKVACPYCGTLYLLKDFVPLEKN